MVFAVNLIDRFNIHGKGRVIVIVPLQIHILLFKIRIAHFVPPMILF